MQSVKIRTLTIEDYDSIVKLWEMSGLPIKPKGRESKLMMKNQMSAFPQAFIGAFHGSRLVGVVIGSYDGRMKGWINRLAVDPDHRRTGIGQKLVEEVERVLTKCGSAVLGALIETPNEESIGLFRRMGYTSHQSILYLSKRENQDV